MVKCFLTRICFRYAKERNEPLEKNALVLSWDSICIQFVSVNRLFLCIYQGRALLAVAMPRKNLDGTEVSIMSFASLFFSLDL